MLPTAGKSVPALVEGAEAPGAGEDDLEKGSGEAGVVSTGHCLGKQDAVGAGL